jgi:hypothetical protein
MNTLARIIYELLSIWEQFKADRKRLKRDELVKKARKNPTGAFNNHFGGLPDDANESKPTDKTEH